MGGTSSKWLWPLAALIVAGLPCGLAAAQAPAAYVNEKSCPLDCCKFGEWTALDAFQVHTTPGRSAAVVTTLAPGTAFRAVGGQTRTEVGRFHFKSASAPFKAGDRVAVYDYRGDGKWGVWSGGKVVTADLGYSPYTDSASPLGEFERAPRSVWWVDARLGGKQRGWIEVRDPYSIGGADTCRAALPPADPGWPPPAD